MLPHASPCISPSSSRLLAPASPSLEADISLNLISQNLSATTTRTHILTPASLYPNSTEHRTQARSSATPPRFSASYMQPEPTKADQIITPAAFSHSPPPSSQHGHRRDNDLQDSLQPHSSELPGEPEPPFGGDHRDATPPGSATSETGAALDIVGLKGFKVVTPPPRDRISEYENARVKTPKKQSEGPLFEVIKSTRKPDDKSSAIAKLPNGMLSMSLLSRIKLIPTRGLDTCHCPSLAQRSRRRVPRLAPLQRTSHYATRLASRIWTLLSGSTGSRRCCYPLGAGKHRRRCAV